MAIDATNPRTRRAILVGAIGAAGATMAAALGSANPGQRRGEAITVGGTFSDATTATSLSNNTNNNAVLSAVSASNGPGTGAGNAISAQSFGGHAVDGATGTGVGVHGSAGFGTGVFGGTSSGISVQGQSEFNAGVLGFSGSTVVPTAPAKTGVFGVANADAASVGVRGQSPAGVGVMGGTSSGVGIQGNGGSGRGGIFSGALAQLRLKPASTGIHPATGQLGDFFLDKSGRLWFCKGDTSWKQLA